MTHESKPPLARRDANASVLKPWVTALPLQMQGSLVCALRGPDAVPKSDPAKALVRALRATIVNNAKGPGPDDVFMGDGTGICRQQELELFFDGVDQYQQHWYLHLMHAAEIVGYLHPNHEVRRFWKDFYERAVDKLHLSPEPPDAMLARLRKDGMIVDADELGTCGVCGYDRLVYVVLTESLRVRLGDSDPRHDRVGLCANCLTPRTARSG